MEKYVKCLQNKVEELELERYKSETEFDQELETIIKRISLKEVCRDCDFEAPNKSRMNLHVSLKHKFYCDICKDYVFGDKHFEEHMEMVHEKPEKTLTHEEFERIQATENIYNTTLSHGDFLRSPNTPRREDWRTKTEASGYWPDSE